MKFTMEGYMELLNLLEKCGYKTTGYFNWQEYDRCVILSHDVDNDMQQALSMARVEYGCGIRSTYFVLLTSNFYNIHTCRNREMIKEIQNMGHTIGLHFDEAAYSEDAGNAGKIAPDIKRELGMLSEALETEVTVFSYHRPTKEILDADIKIPGSINSYGNLFFRQFKYLSDSRMYWREPVSDIIRMGKYPRLHILTHPFWYREEEMEMKEILAGFIGSAERERYDSLKNNFRCLEEVLKWGEK